MVSFNHWNTLLLPIFIYHIYFLFFIRNLIHIGHISLGILYIKTVVLKHILKNAKTQKFEVSKLIIPFDTFQCFYNLFEII